MRVANSLMASAAACRSIIGLDIGGTKIACVEGGFNGEIHRRREIATQAHRPFDQRFPDVTDLVTQLIDEARSAGREVVALSVAVGGPLRISEGLLLNPPHLPGWHNVNLKRRLAERFPSLPVHIEHDGNAGALAEWRFGAGRSRPAIRHLVFLTFGTGLGAGIIVNGKILHGASDMAGEVGHWRLAPDGPEGYGKRGSWEGLASGAGLVLLANRMFPCRWPADTEIRVLVEAMLADDAEALAVAAEAGRWMGAGLALLVDALNPQLIVLGSLGIVLGDRILRSAREVLAQEGLPQSVGACRIVPAELGRRVGDVAALMAALSKPSIARLAEARDG
jgi:glucokinase